MSFLDLYMNNNPLITGSEEDGEPVATIFGVPFDYNKIIGVIGIIIFGILFIRTEGKKN